MLCSKWTLAHWPCGYEGFHVQLGSIPTQMIYETHQLLQLTLHTTTYRHPPPRTKRKKKNFSFTLTLLTFLLGVVVRVDDWGWRGLGRRGVLVVAEPCHRGVGSVPGVRSWPALSVQEAELVIHGGIKDILLVLAGEVTEDTVDWRYLETRNKNVRDLWRWYSLAVKE